MLNAQHHRSMRRNDIQMDRMSDYWAAAADSETVFFTHDAFSRFERFSDFGWRGFLDTEEGGGTVDRVRLADGAEVGVANFMLPRFDQQEYEIDEGMIFLCASLTANLTFQMEGHEPVILNRPELALVRVPRGAKLTVKIPAKVRQQRLIGLFRLTDFPASLGINANGLPVEVMAALTRSGSFGRIVSVPLDETMANLLADTIDTRMEGELRAMQYEARLKEMAAVALNALAERRESTVGLSTLREVQLAKLALDRLSEEFRKPPDLSQLARELGTNPNKLRACFKAAYGVTMAEYCRDRRIREAQQLLLQPRLTIAQVSEMVGYQYPSGFAAAFSAHVGMTPRAYRQNRAPVFISSRATG
ncbi:MAG: AraC family transcriptional regulator [Xanthomonadales bacterium]|nr:AraC family transcriptional regulator [Xanthomonadales bacterium]